MKEVDYKSYYINVFVIVFFIWIHDFGLDHFPIPIVCEILFTV